MLKNYKKNQLPRLFQLINGLLCLICGVIYMLISITQSGILPVIYIGRLLSGFVYGLNHITVILHAADNSAPEIRGTIVRWIPYSKLLLLILASCLSDLTYTSIQLYNGFGVFYIIFAVVALILTPFCVHNSLPLSLEKSQNDAVVLQELTKIRKGEREPGRIRSALTEMKLMLSEDKINGKNVFANGNIKPLLLVIGARVLSILINNVPVLILLTSALYNSTSKVSSNEFSGVLLFQLVLGWIVIFVADRIEFNRFYYGGAVIWSAVLIALSLLDSVLTDTFKYVYWIAIFGYVLIALGIEAISYNQLSEAFPSTKRAWSIVIVTLVESLAYLIILAFFIFTLPFFILLISVSIVAISISLYKFMPNTHGVSLRNARNLFNRSLRAVATRPSAIN